MGPDSAQPQLEGRREARSPVPPAWRTVAASVQGRSHEQRDLPCQDAGAVTVTDDGVLIAVVADGAGSALRAEEGSALAVERALASLAQAVISGPLDAKALEAATAAAFTAARVALEEHAATARAPIADFHTTLLSAVVSGDTVTVGHIGDGVVVIENAGGELETIALPEHGEYANSTYFLTQMPQLADRLHIRSLDRSARAIALTSDGLLDVAFSDPYATCAPWESFFTPLFERIRREPPALDLTPKLAGLLRSAKIRNQTSDDVTLVIAVRPFPVAADETKNALPDTDSVGEDLVSSRSSGNEQSAAETHSETRMPVEAGAPLPGEADAAPDAEPAPSGTIDGGDDLTPNDDVSAGC